MKIKLSEVLRLLLYYFPCFQSCVVTKHDQCVPHIISRPTVTKIANNGSQHPIFFRHYFELLTLLTLSDWLIHGQYHFHYSKHCQYNWQSDDKSWMLIYLQFLKNFFQTSYTTATSKSMVWRYLVTHAMLFWRYWHVTNGLI